MKSRRHKNGSAPFSLFSFQDIITGISGIMIFVLLILSLELTIPEEKKDAEEETRKTLFAQDPMEVFVAGKLEIANSHTTMTKEELSDLYLEDGVEYFKINEDDLPPTIIDEGAINTNQENDSNSKPLNDPKSVTNKGQDGPNDAEIAVESLHLVWLRLLAAARTIRRFVVVFWAVNAFGLACQVFGV